MPAKRQQKYYLESIPILGGKASISTTVKSNGIWQFRVWLEKEGKLYSKSMRTRDIDEAQSKAENEYIKIMADQNEGRKHFGITVKDAIKEWLEWQEERVEAEFITRNRWITIRSQTNHILKYLELRHSDKLKVGEIRPTDFYDYTMYRRRSDRKPQDVTIRNETTTIGSFIKWCNRQAYTPVSKLEFQEIKIREAVRRDTFDLEEYEKLYRYMRTKMWRRPDLEKSNSPNMKSAMRRQFFRDMVLAGANTFLRPGELIQLKWKYVSFIESGKNEYVQIDIPKEISKVRKARTIVTRGAEFFRRIQKYSNFLEEEDWIFVDNEKGTQLSRSERHRMWKDLMEGAGFDEWKDRRLTFYSLRHFGITSRLYAGVSVYEIAKEAGTSVKYIEDHYEHLDVRKLLKNASASFKVDERGVVHRFDRDED
jgi:integrase